MKFIFKIIRILKTTKFIFKKPPKKKTLIFNEKSEIFISNLFSKEDYFCLDTSYKKINLYILIILFIKFKKINPINYYEEIIRTVNPNYIFTFIDNDLLFYKLKKKLRNIKFVSIQNGIRFVTGDILEKLKEDNETYEIDYFFSFDENYSNHMQKYIKGKYITIGSFKNNSFPISSKYEKGTICFISRMSDMFLEYSRHSDFEMIKKNYKNWENELLKYVIQLIKNVYLFCEKKNITLNILGSSPKPDQEYRLFESLIPNKNFVFYPKKDLYSSYRKVDRFEILINPMSTFGYEALARNKKVCFFSGDFIEGSNFNWPTTENKKGIFFSNSNEINEVTRIINNLINIDDVAWAKEISFFKTKRFFFDKNNSKVKNFLKNNKISTK